MDVSIENESCHIYDTGITIYTTGRGDQTQNNYNCQNFKQVFTGVSVTFKQIFAGVHKICSKFSQEKTEFPSLKENPGKLGILNFQFF